MKGGGIQTTPEAPFLSSCSQGLLGNTLPTEALGTSEKCKNPCWLHQNSFAVQISTAHLNFGLPPRFLLFLRGSLDTSCTSFLFLLFSPFFLIYQSFLCFSYEAIASSSSAFPNWSLGTSCKINDTRRRRARSAMPESPVELPPFGKLRACPERSRMGQALSEVEGPPLQVISSL